MKWYDWVSILSLFIIAIAFSVGTYAYYKQEVNECTSDPIIYGVNQMEKLYNLNVTGTLYIIAEAPTQPAIFSFNSENMTRIQ